MSELHGSTEALVVRLGVGGTVARGVVFAIAVVRGEHATSSSDQLMPMEFDGEFAGERSALDVTVLPGALTLCCLASDVGETA